MRNTFTCEGRESVDWARAPVGVWWSPPWKRPGAYGCGSLGWRQAELWLQQSHFNLRAERWGMAFEPIAWECGPWGSLLGMWPSGFPDWDAGLGWEGNIFFFFFPWNWLPLRKKFEAWGWEHRGDRLPVGPTPPCTHIQPVPRDEIQEQRHSLIAPQVAGELSFPISLPEKQPSSPEGLLSHV